MNKYKAIIYDIDGTILKALQNWMRCQKINFQIT